MFDALIVTEDNGAITVRQQQDSGTESQNIVIITEAGVTDMRFVKEAGQDAKVTDLQFSYLKDDKWSHTHHKYDAGV